MNILVNSTGLPWGFNIFGFTDLHGVEGQPSNRFDLSRFYHEYRLRRPLNPDWLLGVKGFDVELEYNNANGQNNSLLRGAIGYQYTIPLVVQPNQLVAMACPSLAVGWKRMAIQGAMALCQCRQSESGVPE